MKIKYEHKIQKAHNWHKRFRDPNLLIGLWDAHRKLKKDIRGRVWHDIAL